MMTVVNSREVDLVVSLVAIVLDMMLFLVVEEEVMEVIVSLHMANRFRSLPHKQATLPPSSGSGGNGGGYGCGLGG